jgi:LysW-gamma-L-lysine carboxypeptidase
MLETYSPSGREEELADLVRQHMISLGFNVRRHRVGNIVGEIGERGPRILLCGHMDTVPGEIPVRTEDGFLYGRGAVDAKSSLAAMLIGSSQATKQSAHPLHLTLAAVVQEETTSAGMKAIIAEGCSYDMAVFGEPSGVSNIVIGYKGSLQLQITILTKSAHSASPWLGKNSFEQAADFWRQFQGSLLQNNHPTKFTAITGTVTKAIAGDDANTIPSHATLDIDVRFPPTLRADQVATKVVDFARQYQLSNEEVRVAVTVKDQCEAFVEDPSSIAVRAFRWAIKNRVGTQVVLVKKTGTSDMNSLAECRKIPMIAFGPGDSSLDHTENERVNITEYLSSIEVYSKAIQKFASMTSERPATLQ